MSYRFVDRIEAGRMLATKLNHYANNPRALVLALPRGGVPVGFEIATALNLPFDIFLVRKLGAPGHEEFAIGALAENGVRFVNQETAFQLRLSEAAIEQIAAREQRELERRKQLYRGHNQPPSIEGRPVIVVDDGLATGATMKAAVQALKAKKAERIIVAVPVGAADTCKELKQLADEVICLSSPEPFCAVGLWYKSFPQLEDSEVVTLLQQAKNKQPPS